MKRSRTGIADGDSALLASRRTPCRFERAIELRKHGTGIVEEGMACVSQLYTTRHTAKQLHIALPFDRGDLSAKRWLLHAEPLRCPRDMAFLGHRDEISE